jgi:outer membrane protein
MLLNERKNQLQTLIQNSRLNRDKTNILVKAGSLAEVRSLEAEAQLATDEANLIDIENQIDKAYFSLKQFINYDVSKPLKIQQVKITAPAKEYTQTDLDVIIGDRLKNLPGVQSARSAQESAKYGVKLAFGNISPKLSAGASLSTAYSSNFKNFSYLPNPTPQIIGFVATDSSPVYTQGFLTTASDIPFGQQLKNNFGQSIGLSLQVPIFNGLQNHYNIQSAKFALNNATQLLSEAENQAKNDIYSAYEGMRMAKKKLDASNLRLRSQEAVFKQTNNTYQLGLTNYYDYSLAQNALSNAQSDALQAKYEYFFQVKVFEYYLGKPVEF